MARGPDAGFRAQYQALRPVNSGGANAGAGQFGTVVSGILSGFGCCVLAHDPQSNAACEARCVRYLPLEELFAARLCPHKVVAGAATVGLVGREGAVLRHTAPACVVFAAAGGAALYLLA